MLALPRHVLYVDEPFNNQTGLEGIHETFPHLSPAVLAAAAEDPYAPIVEGLLKGEARFKPSELRPGTRNPLRQLARELWVSRENLHYKVNSRSPLKQRFLIKDPMACYLSEYLHRRFGMHTVVIMRHPLSTIASYKRLNWHYDVADLLDRTAHFDEALHQQLAGVEVAALRDVERWAYMWLAIYSMLQHFMERNPAMLFVTHEELSQRPHQVLQELYERLGLPFSVPVKQKITAHTSAKNPTEPTGNQPHVLRRNSAENMYRWRHILTTEEAAAIQAITGEFASRFYPETSWE